MNDQCGFQRVFQIGRYALRIGFPSRCRHGFSNSGSHVLADASQFQRVQELDDLKQIVIILLRNGIAVFNGSDNL